MKIGELAKITKLSSHTLRYYERIGLLPRAHRSSSGHRIYDEATLIWLEFLGRLKATDMSIKEMQYYASLRQKGVTTELERLQLLELHRMKVRIKLADLKICLSALDSKIDTYAKNIKQREKNNGKSSHKRTI
jgi:DNA-binding transcriptional MerR regulator